MVSAGRQMLIPCQHESRTEIAVHEVDHAYPLLRLVVETARLRHGAVFVPRRPEQISPRQRVAKIDEFGFRQRVRFGGVAEDGLRVAIEQFIEIGDAYSFFPLLSEAATSACQRRPKRRDRPRHAS